MAATRQPKLPTYTFTSKMPRVLRAQVVKTLGKVGRIPQGERQVLPEVRRHVAKLIGALKGSKEKLAEYASFLPPRVVNACRDASLIPFFGSGISIPAGIPSWGGLLNELGLSAEYVSDPHVEHDALTQAELIAHAIGADALQHKILEITQRVKEPALAHHLLAELRLPVYITTNYDSLFESAWESRWKDRPIVVTNDADVVAWRLNRSADFPLRDNASKTWRPVVIKMHGDAGGATPQLILTRSDYRRHYRANPKLFELIKELMRFSVVFFLGFSHRDPEVARLVDDMVFRFETGYYETAPRPLFSVQFDMRQRTPEVFAARGIVALRPPALFTTLSPDAARSLSVCTELVELLVAITDDAHSRVDIELELHKAVTHIQDDVGKAMAILEKSKDKVLQNLADAAALDLLLRGLLKQLGDRAGQGIYATYEDGRVAGHAVPRQLKRAGAIISFARRPYFRQAQMFRHAFVSDVFESIYNDHATVFFCMPLGTPTHFAGLLFAAAQPGAWKTIVEARASSHPHDFILVDSNGIAVVPPLRDLKPTAPEKVPDGESPAHNQGFPYFKLHELSRRDSQIAHIVQNIVPMGFDDDVHDVSADLRLYSMVAPVKGTRWKLALSKVVPAAVPEVNTAPNKA